MGKLNQLSGVAFNLADSFINLRNSKFLHMIGYLPDEKKGFLEIDLLKETINPDNLAEEAKEAIEYYKKWFLSEIKKLKIEPDEIKNVSIKLSYMLGKSFATHYTCNVTIKTKGKQYSKEAKLSKF